MRTSRRPMAGAAGRFRLRACTGSRSSHDPDGPQRSSRPSACCSPARACSRSAALASAGYGTLVALAAAIVAIGVFAPLHSRSGAIAVVTARVGLALALVPVAGSLATGWSIWLPVLVVTLAIAAGGMAWLVLARRHEGDIPGRLLELALAGTVVGALFAPVGGCHPAGHPLARRRRGALELLRGAGFSLAPSQAQ